MGREQSSSSEFGFACVVFVAVVGADCAVEGVGCRTAPWNSPTSPPMARTPRPNQEGYVRTIGWRAKRQTVTVRVACCACQDARYHRAMLRGRLPLRTMCVLAGAAYADNKEAAKEAYSEGKRQYDLGEYDAALAAFKKAYLNYEEPVFLFNIAQCYPRARGSTRRRTAPIAPFCATGPRRPTASRSSASSRSSKRNSRRRQRRRRASHPNASPRSSTSRRSRGRRRRRPSRRRRSPRSQRRRCQRQRRQKQAQGGGRGQAGAGARQSSWHGRVGAQLRARPSGQHQAGQSGGCGQLEIAVGIGGVAAAAIVIGVTQSASGFDSTLPTFNVNNMGLRTLTVRF